MIFTREQVALVRAGRITATIIPATRTPPRPDTIQPLWRRHTRHDENNTPIDTISEIVYDVQGDRPDEPIRLTIQAVKTTGIEFVDQSDAHACGYKTANALRDAWLAEHPRTFMIRVVRFTVGDLRDKGRWIGWTGRAGGDYTTNPRRAADDAEALQASDVALFAKQAREQDRRRRQNPDQKLRDDLISDLERINDRLIEWKSKTGGTTDKDRQGAIRGIQMATKTIRRQLAVLDRKLKAA